MSNKIALLLLLSVSGVMIVACTMSKPVVVPSFQPLQAPNSQAE